MTQRGLRRNSFIHIQNTLQTLIRKDVSIFAHVQHDFEMLLFRGYPGNGLFDALYDFSVLYWQWLPPSASKIASKRLFPGYPLNRYFEMSLRGILFSKSID